MVEVTSTITDKEQIEVFLYVLRKHYKGYDPYKNTIERKAEEGAYQIDINPDEKLIITLTTRLEGEKADDALIKIYTKDLNKARMEYYADKAKEREREMEDRKQRQKEIEKQRRGGSI